MNGADSNRDRAAPFIIDQRPGGNGTVLVTWSLPGLRRVTVSVPETVYLNGEHGVIGGLAHDLLSAMLPPPAPEILDSEGYGDDGG